MTKHFLQRLGIRYPIIQAPMAGVSTPALAAAVSEAGGLGSLGLGASSVAQAREAIETTRALTSRPFNVNVFCHAPPQRDAEREAAWIRHLAPLYAEQGADLPASLVPSYSSYLEDEVMAALLLDLKPAVVSFHFGIPAHEHVRALREAGIVTMATATCLHDAERIEAAGIDAIVAQGIEAGGHRGDFDPAALDEALSTSVLLRLLAQKIRLPLIAAGGIMDGAGIRAALDLGAVAAQLGTAFVLAPESSASAAYRRALKSPHAASTRLTRALSGRRARGIVNRMIEHCETDAPEPPDYPVAYDAAKQLFTAAAKQGVEDLAAHWAGQGAPLVREMPAAGLVALLAEEAGF